MGSTGGYAVVPVLGGLILIVGGLGTLLVDRRVLLQNPGAPRPVYLRYTSQATYDLKQPPHWVFLTCTVLFAPFLTVTASWQRTIAISNEQDESSSSIADDIQLFAYLCAVCGVGVAASPMGNLAGSIAHMILAGGFAAFGINYCVRVQTLASDRGDSAIATIRNICWILAAVGGFIMIFGVYPAGVGTEKLARHERGEEELSRSEIVAARRNELILAIGQVSVGIMIGIVVITAAVEVGDVADEENSNDALVIGLVSAAIGLVVFGVAYMLNETLYNLCQKGKEDDAEAIVVEEEEQAEES